jgi:hypothetical protein
MPSINFLLAIPHKTPAAFVDDLKSPGWQLKHNNEVQRESHRYRFGENKVTTRVEQLGNPSKLYDTTTWV